MTDIDITSLTPTENPFRDLPNEILCEVAKDLDLWDLTHLIEAYPYISTILLPVVKSNLKQPALFWAANSGNCHLVKVLLRDGADINAVDSQGNTVLYYAVLYFDERLFGTESLQKADQPTTTPETRELIYASHKPIVKLLVANGALINVQSGTCTALYAAAKNANSEMVELLLQLGADPNIPTVCGDTPLLSILSGRNGYNWGDKEPRFGLVVDLLLEGGADTSSFNESGHTVLGLAAQNGYIGTIKLLLNKGIFIDEQDKDGLTALCWAASCKETEAVRCLLARGASVNIQDKDGRTALHSAIEDDFCGVTNMEIINLLLTFRAGLNIADNKGRTSCGILEEQGFKFIVGYHIQDNLTL